MAHVSSSGQQYHAQPFGKKKTVLVLGINPDPSALGTDVTDGSAIAFRARSIRFGFPAQSLAFDTTAASSTR